MHRWARTVALVAAAWVLAALGCTSRTHEAAPVDGRVVILFSTKDSPEMHELACPPGRCLRVSFEADPCSALRGRARAVVLTGHSLPPEYLHHSVTEIAASIRCLNPELVVLDTCYGFSSPLLTAIAATGVSPVVVGATYKLPPSGLLYEPAFFEDGPIPIEARAAAVHARSGAPLTRWRIEAATLGAAEADVARWSAQTLKANLKRVNPNLVVAPLGEGGPVVLFPVEPARFRERAGASP